MMVFFRARLVLLAVPKTGSTALEAALRGRADVVIAHPPRLRHMTPARYDRRLRRLFEEAAGAPLETVAVMREPLDWLGSWYRYRQRPFLDGTPNSTRELDFDAFVDGYLRTPRAPFAAVGEQGRFLGLDAEGGSRVDHVFAHERMERVTAFLAARLGAPVRLDRVNASAPAELALDEVRAAALRARLAPEIAFHRTLLDARPTSAAEPAISSSGYRPSRSAG